MRQRSWLCLCLISDLLFPGSCSGFNNQRQLSTDPIAIGSVLGVFYMLTAGIGYSIFAFFVEHLIFRIYVLPRKERKEKEKEQLEVSKTLK